MRSFYCSRCSQELEDRRYGKHCYCLKCHAKYMREHRPKHSELSEHERLKANARSYANVYLRRGKIVKEDCKCGAKGENMHHEDYSKPLEIIWMCRKCHLEYHDRFHMERYNRLKLREIVSAFCS